MRAFWMFLLWVFAGIGFLATLIFLLLGYTVAHFAQNQQLATNKVVVDEQTVLTLDLQKAIPDADPSDPVQILLNERTTTFSSVMAALKKGANDNRVKGLVVRGGSTTFSIGKIQELRDAVAFFRSKGKFAYVFGDSFGDLGGGTRPYYLASAFDQVWVQPGGTLGLNGFSIEIPFFKGTFDLLGIKGSFERRGEYKSAATQFTENKLPDTDKRAMTELYGSVFDQVVAGMAAGRKLSAEEMKSLIDNGPYPAREALEKHLIDKIGYRDEMEEAARKAAGSGSKLLALSAYARTIGPNDPSLPAIAVIRLNGAITDGGGGEGVFDDNDGIHADRVVRVLDQVSNDNDVKAVILRINSPGGSAIASETIWRAVQRVKRGGKKVVVSMSDVAASGGYYIAAAADKIIAEPGTITGSIGVFGGKFITAGLTDKIGISFDKVTFGRNAGIESSQSDFTPEQRKRFAGLIDETYSLFLTRVADGRHLEKDKVDQIARGRVWTGIQAKERDLVDALGGLDVAVDSARELAKIPLDQKIRVIAYPPPRPFAEVLNEFLANGLENGADARVLMKELKTVQPLLERLNGVMVPANQTLRMEPSEMED